jgi:hypothetical protein
VILGLEMLYVSRPDADPSEVFQDHPSDHNPANSVSEWAVRLDPMQAIRQD